MQKNSSGHDTVRCLVTISLTIKKDSDWAGIFVSRYKTYLNELFNIFGTLYKPDIVLEINIRDYDKPLKWNYEFLITKNLPDFDRYSDLFRITYDSLNQYVHQLLNQTGDEDLLDMVMNKAASMNLDLDFEECRWPIHDLQKRLEGHWKRFQNTYLNDLSFETTLTILEPTVPDSELDENSGEPPDSMTREPEGQDSNSGGNDNVNSQPEPNKDPAYKNLQEDENPSLPFEDHIQSPPEDLKEPDDETFTPFTVRVKLRLLSLCDEPHQFMTGQETLSCYLNKKEDKQWLYANVKTAKEQGIWLQVEKEVNGFVAHLILLPETDNE
jgi:hypothetical protein